MAKHYSRRIKHINGAVIGRKVFSLYFFVRKNKTIDFFENSPYNKKTTSFDKIFYKSNDEDMSCFLRFSEREALGCELPNTKRQTYHL